VMQSGQRKSVVGRGSGWDDAVRAAEEYGWEREWMG
jgi:hypothetical protein